MFFQVFIYTGYYSYDVTFVINLLYAVSGHNMVKCILLCFSMCKMCNFFCKVYVCIVHVCKAYVHVNSPVMYCSHDSAHTCTYVTPALLWLFSLHAIKARALLLNVQHQQSQGLALQQNNKSVAYFFHGKIANVCLKCRYNCQT